MKKVFAVLFLCLLACDAFKAKGPALAQDAIQQAECVFAHQSESPLSIMASCAITEIKIVEDLLAMSKVASAHTAGACHK